MLQVPKVSTQAVELGEMGREIGEVEGNPDARPSSRNQEAERDHEAGVDQSMELAGGKQEAGVVGRKQSGKSVRFAADLPKQEAEDIL